MIGPTVHDWVRTALFLPPESSTVASSIDSLHFWVIGTTLLGTAAIGAFTLYFALRYRHRGEDLSAGRLEGNTSTPLWLEWCLGLGLFALFITWWVVGFSQYVDVRVAPEDAYDVYVTGKQWMWTFSYAEGRHSISTLYVPVGRPVRLLMTSRDVIHSFYVPDFRLKQDVLPGRYTTLWFEVREPGMHRVLCAEYCGTNHSAMRAQVIALSPEDFAAWIARGDEGTQSDPPWRSEPSVAGELGPSRPDSLIRVGEAVAAQAGCLRCHTLDGRAHIGPSFAGLYRSTVRLADGSTALADEAYLTESMMDPATRVHEGYSAVMPSYLGRLQPAEVAALLALIKSLGGAAPPSRRAPGEPWPDSEGLPPPGAVETPAMDGEVKVGPKGVVRP